MNNDSFIRWLSGRACVSEMEEWENWRQLNKDHEQLMKKAKLIVNMPFLEYESPNIELELLRLQKTLKET
jgi:hypothetical protein